MGSWTPHLETLSDDQLLRVLARPGFSTAEAVTSVSGRGVGIDVAMTKIRALGGTIEVQTEVGRGTTFILRLPVTLAIVRALIADVGGERYALPLTYVAETVEFGTVPITTVEGREAMVLRDRVVPLVHLRALLGAADGPPSAAATRGRAADGRAAHRPGGGRDAGPAGDRGEGVRRPRRDAAGVQRGDHHGRRGAGVDLWTPADSFRGLAWRTCAT